MSADRRRDIVVIGASAGGVESLSRLVSHLPPDLGAAVFVVLHLASGIRSRLPEILTRRGPLPARHARDGDAIEPGRILVAPPDFHLMLDGDEVRLGHGPRQNSVRPAIDVLFRSAAANHGSRVVGVVLSGYLDDGAEGLRDIVLAGGVGIAQEPSEALNPEMPENAIARGHPQGVLPVAGIARTIAEMAAGETVGKEVTPMPRETGEPLEPPRSDVQIGAADTPGSPTGLTCPECHGVPWVGPDASALHSISLWRGAEVYHCRVGHSYSIETLREQQALAVEQALWAAVRSLREQAPVSGHIASRAEQRGTHSIVARYRERQSVANQHADVLEAMLSEPEEVGAETTQTPSRFSLACRPRPPRSAG